MKRILSILGISVLVFSCSVEEIIHPSEADAPLAARFEPVVTVDQETNQVTFSLPSGTKGVIPVWVLQDKNGEFTTYAAQDGLTKIFTSAGDYKVRLQIMNAAGVSPDYVEKTFHVDNTIVNFDRYIRFLAGTSSKQWRIDNTVPAHFGCGPSGTTGTEWWAAAPDEKAAVGLYDNRVTFTNEYGYTFDPGESGTLYVNTGVTAAPYGAFNTNDGQDYTVPVDPQQATYSFEVSGDDLFLVLPAGTRFPYIPNADFMKNPRFRVESADNNTLNLVCDNGEIAWHFTLTSKAPTDGPREYKYDSDANLWKGADADGGLTLSYYYAPGWAQIADPALEKAGAKYTWTLPSATSDRWQAQMFLVPVTPISLTEDASYDFSCVLSASADVTPKVKIHRFDENGSDADNGVVLLDVDVPLKAGEDVIVDASALAGIAAGNIRIVLDWGGNPDNAEVSINRIVLKDHSVDDGTHQGGGSDEVKFDYDAASNLWKAADQAHTYSYYYAPGWAQIADPKTTQEGNVYTLSFPEATFDQWQAQFFIIPDAPIALSAEKAYDFQVILNSSTDHGNITLKLTDTTDDGNFLFTNMVAAEAYEDMVFRFTNLPGIDAEAVKLVFDFGRNAADTEITIREIILQEHVAGSGGEPEPGPGPDVPGEDPLRIDAPSNLWRSASMNNTFWYADGGWSQIADPMTFPADDFGGLKVIIPYEIGGSEWQGQTVWHTDIKATAGETYDFGFTVNSDEDIYAMTVKLAWEGHDGDHAFFYENSISVKARETFKFRKIEIAPDVDYDKVVLFIDLGRCKRGTAVSFTDFCFQPHGQWYDVDGPSNLWNSATVTNTYWYADGGWSQIANPETQALANHGLKVTIPAGIGGAEWQGQTVWHTDIPAFADKKYDFCCRILSDEDAVLTVKLAWEGNDNDHAFFYENAVSVKAGESFRFEKPGISPDADYDKIVLFIDCGRCPAGSEVSFTGFCFQEHID